MRWEAWVIVLWLIVSYGLLIARIGAVRKQTEVAWGIVDYTVLIWLTLRLAGVA